VWVWRSTFDFGRQRIRFGRETFVNDWKVSAIADLKLMTEVFSQMNRYFAFGLRIASSDSLPGLVPLDDPEEPDVQIWLNTRPATFEKTECLSGSSVSGRRVFLGQPGDLLVFRYADETEFCVSPRGRQIWASWPDSLTKEDMATYLLGPILGYVLRLRGLVALHASAVSLDGRAIVLVGPSGAGKSTTAAAFALRGFEVLADDVSAVESDSGILRIRPAYPHLRLWPSSVRTLLGDQDALKPITPNWEKRDFPLLQFGSFSHGSIPLAVVYLLGTRSDRIDGPSMELLSQRNAVLELVANTYGNSLLDEAMRVSEFNFLSGLVREIPVRRIVPHASPERLGALCDTILNDFQGIDSVQNRNAVSESG
jgi:hypothetical protein